MRDIAFRIVRSVQIQQRYPLLGYSQQQAFAEITHHKEASIPTERKLGFQPEILSGKASACGQKTPRSHFANQAQDKPEQHEQRYQNSNGLKIGPPGKGAFRSTLDLMGDSGFGMQRNACPLRLDSGRRDQRRSSFLFRQAGSLNHSFGPGRRAAAHTQPNCLTRSMGLMISVRRTPNFSLMTTASPRATSLPLT